VGDAGFLGILYYATFYGKAELQRLREECRADYQTTTGSEVGDRYMSLAMSARVNGAEPVAYIAHCLENHEDLKKRPEHYLPWVYAARMKEAAKPPDDIQLGVVTRTAAGQ
jgi:hypothetical protein